MKALEAAWVQLGLAVLLLGASWPVTKLALLDGAAPSWFAFGRAVLSGLVLAVLLAARSQVRMPGRADVPALLALGLLQLGGFFILAHEAVAWVPAGRTAVLSNATLVWTVPISLMVAQEAIPRRRWVAAGLSALGVVALVGPWSIAWEGPALVGHALLLGASLCWAVAMAIVRRWPPRGSMFQLLPWAFGLAALMLLPLALAHAPGRWSGRGLVALGAIGLVMGPLGTWCVAQATTALPLVVASVGLMAGPAVGLLLSVLFLGEAFTGSLALGTAAIMSGAVVAATGGRR